MNESKFYLKLGFTDDTASLGNKVTRNVTKGPGHVIVIVLEVKADGTHDQYYFESIGKTDSVTHKSGVRGPIPITDVETWAAAAKTRSFITVPEIGFLPLTQHEAEDAVCKMRNAVNTIYYAPLQLASNGLAARLHLRVTFGDGSPLSWTCCEMPIRTRVIPPRWWDLVGMDNINADEIWPGGTSMYSLYAAAQRIVDKYGRIQAP